MISVDEALAALFELVSPLEIETVPLRAANRRYLAQPVTARRSQPPFDASSMDGYALRGVEREQDALFKVIGEAAAGHAWTGTVGPGEAVRIFTGAPIPSGADFVVIQEDVDRKADLITITNADDPKDNIRKTGIDFSAGDRVSPKRLGATDLALLASMNIADVPVFRRPHVALISTGDELVMPGETPRDDQIIASNTFGLAAMLEDLGAVPRVLPIARDNPASLRTALDLAAGADLVVTIGGASVGDHDLVAQVAADAGMEQTFYKVRMRPGKPLMAGRLRGTPMVGLPGNPVSAMVCGRIFLAPMINAMLGQGAHPAQRQTATLAAPLAANGPREHYMRAVLDEKGVRAAEDQDSSLLSVLAEANALIVRPPEDQSRNAGEPVVVVIF